MPKVHPIRVFDIESESRRGLVYKVQYDGSRWFCNCMSWVNNVEHRGEKDEEGRAVPRECKHTRRALSQMRTHGEKAGRLIQPIGPWFEELQEYIAALVDLSRNGTVEPERFAGFHADYDRFKGEVDRVRDVAETADTMLGLYKDLLRQVSEQV